MSRSDPQPMNELRSCRGWQSLMSPRCERLNVQELRTVESGNVRSDQIANLLTVWNTSNNFSGAYGVAMDLDLTPTAGSPRRSFRELVQTACPGADEEALLDELVASESVEVVDSITVRCVSRAYPATRRRHQADSRGQVASWLTSPTALLTTWCGRLMSPSIGAEAVVSDEPLTEAGRDKFLATAGERGQELLTELDAFATRLARTEQSSTGRIWIRGLIFLRIKTSLQRRIRPERMK